MEGLEGSLRCITSFGAKRLTGFQRRLFMAEVTTEHGTMGAVLIG